MICGLTRTDAVGGQNANGSEHDPLDDVVQGPHDDDSEIINDDTNVSEVSSTACSGDLRPNTKDPTWER